MNPCPTFRWNPPRFPLVKAANITLLRLCHTWTENARRPLRGAALFFWGGYAPVGRDPCVPPPGTHFSAGHAGPALRGAAIAGGCGHPPLRTSNGAFRAGRRTKVNGLPRPPHPNPPQNTTNPELFCRKSPRFVTLPLIMRLLSCNFSLPVVDWFRTAV